MKEISADYLKECLTYDPATGIFVWKKRPLEHFSSKRECSRWNTRYSGRRAGSNKNGYRAILINFSAFLEHRLAWVMVHGYINNLVIDHINGNKSDNRIVNLRLVTFNENQRNRCLHERNSTGVYGVHTRMNKWTATIKCEDERLWLGTFSTLLDAVAARKSAENRLGFFPGHGKTLPGSHS